jgi:hypothetical protein
LWFAYGAKKSRAVTWRRNFLVLVNLPKQVPRESRFSRATCAAYKKKFSYNVGRILIPRVVVAYLLHDLFRDVEDPLPVQPKAVESVLPLDEALDVVADVLGQLLEEDLRLLLGQGTHDQIRWREIWGTKETGG